MSCGKRAFYTLCLMYGIEKSEVEKILISFEEECSFHDFYNGTRLLGRCGIGLSNAYERGYEPFIAHISLLSFNHFVVVISYGCIVSFVDVDGKKYSFPKWLFNLGYTGELFCFVNCEKS